MKPCFGYIRVSTQKQGEGVSLEAQQDAISAYADQNGLAITKWFEEQQTAAKGGRPVFNQMLKSLKRGDAVGLVMHKIDRSARNLTDWAMVSELPNLGIEVYFVTESLDFGSRGGRLAANLQAVIAEDYIHNLREESIKGLTGRLKQGLYPYRAPIGYLDNGRGKPKTPDPLKAPLIRQMFKLYGTGQYSLRSLQAEINRLGLKNHSDKPVTLRGIETILNNTFYTGLITIVRTGETYKGIHKPIVTTAMFNRVQSIKSGKSGPKLTRHDHKFQGVFRCGHCDAAMTPEIQKGHTYYRCQTKGCPTATIREERLEEAIQHELKRLELSKEEVDRLLKGWRKAADDQSLADQRTALIEAIAEEERRQDRLTDLLIDGAIDSDVHKKRRRSGELKIAELKENLQNLPNLDLMRESQSQFLELLNTLTRLYEAANTLERRLILKNVFSNRHVVGKYIELEPQNWVSNPENLPAVLQCDPAGVRDTELPGVPAGYQNLEPLISLKDKLVARPMRKAA